MFPNQGLTQCVELSTRKDEPPRLSRRDGVTSDCHDAERQDPVVDPGVNAQCDFVGRVEVQLPAGSRPAYAVFDD